MGKWDQNAATNKNPTLDEPYSLWSFDFSRILHGTHGATTARQDAHVTHEKFNLCQGI